MSAARASIASSLLFFVSACGAVDPTAVSEPEASRDRFSSDQATLLVFELDAEYRVASYPWSTRRLAEQQLMYTIGHLNGDNSVGRLDKMELTNFNSERQEDGTYRVSYHVALPVGWGSKTNLPTSYELTLPSSGDGEALEAFTEKYKESCVDSGADDVDSGSMWYYYRPRRSGCELAPDDVLTFTASVTVSDENTTGKYPEYHKVWEDDALDVVAIFGKYEDGATEASDAGIAAFNRFVSLMRTELGSEATTTPAELPSAPGVEVPDVTFETTRDGRTTRVTMLLVDNVRTAGAEFDARYAALSGNADLIFYNGHSGLGANIRALAGKGKFLAGKYQIFFMNGCDTFAYVDGALAQTRAGLNEDDPSGTKYLDMVTNVMPSYFSSTAYASRAIIRGLSSYDAPKTYDAIFAEIDRSQVVLVTGEEDNVYYPGYGQDPGDGSWAGLNEAGVVARDEIRMYETPVLPAGRYNVHLRHDPNHSGGDADLYVRIGEAPTTSTYDCRPYKGGSDEDCTLTLAEPAKIFVMVRGYGAGDNAFVLTALGTATSAFAGMHETGLVAQHRSAAYETPLLDAGTYTVTLADDPAAPGGDADLYARAGSAPTMTAFDCRPYLEGSNETCTFNLTGPTKLYLMVRGYSAGRTAYVLTVE